MPENLLGDLDVAGGVEYALRESVTEQVRMSRDACLSTNVPQGRLKRRIAEGFALTFSRSDPNGMNARRRAALVAQGLFVNRPEIIGYGHAQLITRTLQPHGDESPFAIDILQFHTQNPVSASNRTPIADALTSARQQYQNRFITIGPCVVDQLLNRCRLQDLRQSSWNTAAKSVTLPLGRRPVPPHHP